MSKALKEDNVDWWEIPEHIRIIESSKLEEDKYQYWASWSPKFDITIYELSASMRQLAFGGIISPTWVLKQTSDIRRHFIVKRRLWKDLFCKLNGDK
jgi:hypothetical protein